MIAIIVEAALRSLVLGLIAWLVLSVLRPRNPHVHQTVWVAVLVASLSMPLIMRLPLSAVIAVPPSMLTLSAGDALPMAASAVPAWVSLGALYLAITTVLACRLGWGLFSMWRIKRDAHVLHESWTEGLDVRVSTRLASPVTFASTILLPVQFTQWSATQRVAVMAHERSHVRQRDCYVVWLARANTCIFWLNPLSWWLARRIGTLAETTSDDAVLEATGDRSAYAELLLTFARQPSSGRVAMAMAQSNVPMRIERIISGIAPSSALRVKQRVLIAAALLPIVAVATVPMETPQSSPTQQESATEPHITDWGDPANLEKYYPPQAAKQGTEGLVDIAVTLDRKGRATDTLILSEDPLDMGFGAAASQLAHLMTYSNPTGRPAQFHFKVKFALGED